MKNAIQFYHLFKNDKIELTMIKLKWENFFRVIKRAMIVCENSGHDVSCDFPKVSKTVEAGAITKAFAEFFY